MMEQVMELVQFVSGFVTKSTTFGFHFSTSNVAFSATASSVDITTTITTFL